MRRVAAVFLLGSTLPFRWAWISTAATQVRSAPKPPPKAPGFAPALPQALPCHAMPACWLLLLAACSCPVSCPVSCLTTAAAHTQGATLLFYAVTGYKFRPMRSNPYLRVSQEDEDEIRQFEMDAMVRDTALPPTPLRTLRLASWNRMANRLLANRQCGPVTKRFCFDARLAH